MARILVIDDCRNFHDWADSVLQREGLEVIAAHDALAGLQRAVEDAPDLIVVSESLSGLGGFEVCERLAGEPALRGVPIIVLSDDASPAQRLRAAHAGAQAVLPRSLRRADLSGPIIESLWAAGVSRFPAGRPRIPSSA